MAEIDSNPTSSSLRKKLWEQLSNNFFVIAGGGSMLLAIGSIYMVAVLSSVAFEQSFEEARTKTPWFDGLFWFMLGITILGLIAAIIAFINQTPRDDGGGLPQYDYALVGLGFTLALIGILNFVALSGFAFGGHLDQILIYDDAQKCTQQLVDNGQKAVKGRCQIYQMVRLALMPGFAILGSLFFVAGSLRQKRDVLEKRLWFKQRQTTTSESARSPDEVDEDLTYRSIKFWGGLWYRMGEAILFALVVYIVLKTVSSVEPGASTSGNPAARQPGLQGPGLLGLLALSLVIGMFVKPAEVLINGIGQRLFGAAKELTKS